jgi:hypothetical protein
MIPAKYRFGEGVGSRSLALIIVLAVQDKQHFPFLAPGETLFPGMLQLRYQRLLRFLIGASTSHTFNHHAVAQPLFPIPIASFTKRTRPNLIRIYLSDVALSLPSGS